MDEPSDFGGLFSARRIVVVGANGAGKTWLAGRIATALDLPLYHNDALALTTGWARRPSGNVVEARTRIADSTAWVLEGGPSTLSDAVLARVQVIIWLDIPRHLRFWRVLKRTLLFLGRERPEHPPGNREWPGRRQVGFLVKTWTHDSKARDWILQCIADSHAPVIRLRSTREVAALVAQLKAHHAAAPLVSPHA